MRLPNYLLLVALLAQVPVSVEPNDFQCYACSYPATSCNKTDIAVQNCTGLENQCVTISRFLIGEDGVSKGDVIHGGCSYNRSCTAPLGYQTFGMSSLCECCNSSLCNNATMGSLNKFETLNGVKCFSCKEGRMPNTDSSSQNETPIECIGPMSMCMEAVATDGLHNRTVNMKGCATPAWCQRPFHAGNETGDFQRVRCCQGNLCNGQELNAATAAAWSTSTSAQNKPSPKIHKNGGSLVVGTPQITAAFLLIATSWNLLMFPGF